MTGRRGGGGPMVGLAAIIVAAAGPRAAGAQVAGDATPVPTPTASAALPIPPAPVIVVPAPAASATPRATPSATPMIAAGRPSPPPAKATSGSTPPIDLPSSTPTPTPAAPMAAIAVPATRPSPRPAASASPIAPPAAEGGIGWAIPVAAGVLALLAVGWLSLRRRGARDATVGGRLADGEIGAPVARARLAMTFRPVRAGLNLLSAISENEVVLANVGDAPADDIRVLTQLTTAHAGQDTELATIHAAPIGRPAVPAFALAPGEQRAITSVAALPRDAIRPLTVAGRPMIVPIVAVNVLYTTGGIEAQLAQAFAIGVERVDSAKLAPFWLDVPPRTVEQVAARPHAAAIER